MNEIDLQRIALAVKSGAAVSLFGAGFARLGNDSSGKPLPSTTELTNEVKKLFKVPIEENVSLSDVADYADSQTDGKSRLRHHLVARLTVCDPSETQRRLVKLPWRSIFTTNFDDIIERSDQSKKLTHVTPTMNQSSIPANKTPLYYPFIPLTQVWAKPLRLAPQARFGGLQFQQGPNCRSQQS